MDDQVGTHNFLKLGHDDGEWAVVTGTVSQRILDLAPWVLLYIADNSPTKLQDITTYAMTSDELGARRLKAAGLDSLAVMDVVEYLVDTGHIRYAGGPYDYELHERYDNIRGIKETGE